MDDYQNPESSTPENKEPTPSVESLEIGTPVAVGTTLQNDNPMQNYDIPRVAQPQSPFQNTYSVNNYQSRSPIPQSNTYYTPGPVPAPGPYPQNNIQPQNAYQTQNAYQPQQPYSYNQPQNNYPPQYAYPPNYPPQYYSYNNPERGKATASLVLGIISLVFCWMSFFAVISVICSIIGLIMGNSARKELTPDQGQGQATAGMVCSIIGLVLSVLMIILFTVLLITAVSYSTEFGATYGM